jgi:hypothetical protein
MRKNSESVKHGVLRSETRISSNCWSAEYLFLNEGAAVIFLRISGAVSSLFQEPSIGHKESICKWDLWRVKGWLGGGQ